MGIKAGEVVSIRHYSGFYPFKSVILDYQGDNIIIKLTRDFSQMNFLEGDPVVMTLLVEEEVISIGCLISQIHSDKGIVHLKIDSIERQPERREHPRYPVSLYADVRKHETRRKYLAIIKDINFYGICLYSKAEFDLNDHLELSMYVDLNMVFLDTVLVRKENRDKHFEYGARIIYKDESTMNLMEEYLKKLKKSYESDIKKFKNMIE